MSVPPPRLALERLFTPGARLGWIFRDLRTIVAPYPEPEPDAGRWRRRAAARAEAAQARYDRARRWTVRPCLAAMLLFLLLAGFLHGSHDPDDAWVALLAAAAVGGCGLGYTAGCWFQNRRDQAAAARPEQDYDQAHAEWRERAAEHRSGELERLGRLARLGRESEWGSAESPTRRTDVFGGSLRGWQALLTTHGASILAAQPLLVMDLSGQLASGQLTATARQAGVPAAQYVLPADLDRCGLLSRLTPAELTGALAEAIHAGAPGGARSDRAVDARVLQQLTGALDGRVTPARLAAAAQSALGHPVLPGLLSAREEALIGGDLFAAEYRRQIGPNLVRLDAFLAELARYAGRSPAAPGAGGDARPAYYTCLALEAGARSAHGEMLAALAIQWLTVQVSASPASAPAAIIAGADEITRPHLERLSDACERRGVPLTLMFRHLREDSLQLLGGGTAAFMRLGNHAEAEQAASYIGRRHTFVLSQRTVTLGTNDSTTRTDTDGRGVSDSGTVAFGAGWPGNPLDLGQRSRGVSTSRNWSTAMSWADGTSWSDSAGTQRVYEYAVEPAVLQSLPDRALLLAVRGTAGSAGPLLRAVECDPGIVTLPGVSTRPLAALPMPRRPGGAQVMSAAATMRRHQPR
jgi:hypothetical protein